MIAAEIANIHNQNIADEYVALFKKVGFYGLVMVEVKEEGNNFFMIEANPRFWGPLQLVVDSGVNLLEWFLYDNNFLENEPTLNLPEPVKYFWSQGQNQYRPSRDIFYIGRSQFDAEKKDFAKFDIYNRLDTARIFRGIE
jgi:hypothetical protein